MSNNYFRKKVAFAGIIAISIFAIGSMNVLAQPVAEQKLTITSATAADKPAIAKQRVCAVTGGKLGGMGTPVKVTAGDKLLFLCCKGCIGPVKKDPDKYFAKAAKLRKAK